MLLLIALDAFCSTFVGGLFAIRLKDKLHLVLGFGAGAVLAVALADLLPEALAMGQPTHSPTSLPGWLMLSFLLYLAGVVSTLFFSIGRANLGVTLAIFAGFFLYIGASDLIPESYHAHPETFMTAMTLAGAAVIYGAVCLAGG